MQWKAYNCCMEYVVTWISYPIICLSVAHLLVSSCKIIFFKCSYSKLSHFVKLIDLDGYSRGLFPFVCSTNPNPWFCLVLINCVKWTRIDLKNSSLKIRDTLDWAIYVTKFFHNHCNWGEGVDAKPSGCFYSVDTSHCKHRFLQFSTSINVRLK